MTKDEKQTAHEILCRRFEEQQQQVADIESRLHDYFSDLCANPELHNGNELLCGVKFLRLLRTYPFNHKKVRQVIRLREGEWQRDQRGVWQYIDGGIKQPLTTGDAVLRWEPFQIFILACIYGPQAWIDTELTLADRATLLPTERINEQTGHIEDLRRLCTNFTLFGPRKIDKTGISAFVSIEHFLLEDPNSEIYCTSNAAAQSALLYRRIKHALTQLDPEGKRMRITETVTDWRAPYQHIRNSSIRPLSAGGKTKDGMFAQLCCADEYGSAAYTNNKCDMKRLVDVTESSMGPRREPLTIITTTAGRIASGPFIEKLDALHARLLDELKYESGEQTPLLDRDRISCILLEPDEWEREDTDAMLESKDVRRKINPMLGKIVQHSFYDGEITKAKDDGDLGEVISKLFNVYQSAQVKPWMTSDRILPLQIDRRITDCHFRDGWIVFNGLDFTRIGDDLLASTYLGVNMRPSNTMAGRFFADCDVWVLEDVLKRSPNRPLYETWIQQGWLNVCPGETFNSDLAINALVDKCFEQDAEGNRRPRLDIKCFGYDAAQSLQPINQLKAWLYTLGISPENIEKMVVPVPQTALCFNPVIANLEDMILQEEPWIQFSRSPLWGWCIGNARQEISTRNDLRRLVKSGPNQKIDPLHALLNALHCWSLFQSRVQK